MKKELNLTGAKRGSALDAKGKTRITIYVDDDVLSHFRKIAASEGIGYQTAINRNLRQSMERPIASSFVGTRLWEMRGVGVVVHGAVKNVFDEHEKMQPFRTATLPTNVVMRRTNDAMHRDKTSESKLLELY
jgi:hypothetical protein